MPVQIDFTKRHSLYPRVNGSDHWWALGGTNGEPSGAGYQEIIVVPSWPAGGSTAFYPTITYTFTSGQQIQGKVSFNRALYNTNLIGAGHGSGWWSFILYYPPLGSTNFMDCRISNTPNFPVSNTQSAMENWQSNRQVQLVLGNTGASSAGGINPNYDIQTLRRFVSPDNALNIVWAYWLYRIAEVPTTSTPYEGSADTTQPNQSNNVLDNNNFPTRSWRTSDYVGNFDTYKDFWVDLGNDYVTLYNEFIDLNILYNQALADSAQQAADSGGRFDEELGNPEAVRNLAATGLVAPSALDTPLFTRQAAKLLKKVEKANEELVQLTDAGMELDPRFAKITDKFASFAAAMFNNHTFKRVVDADSLKRVKGGGKKM